MFRAHYSTESNVPSSGKSIVSKYKEPLALSSSLISPINNHFNTHFYSFNKLFDQYPDPINTDQSQRPCNNTRDCEPSTPKPQNLSNFAKMASTSSKSISNLLTTAVDRVKRSCSAGSSDKGGCSDCIDDCVAQEVCIDRIVPSSSSDPRNGVWDDGGYCLLIIDDPVPKRMFARSRSQKVELAVLPEWEASAPIVLHFRADRTVKCFRGSEKDSKPGKQFIKVCFHRGWFPARTAVKLFLQKEIYFMRDGDETKYPVEFCEACV